MEIVGFLSVGDFCTLCWEFLNLGKKSSKIYMAINSQILRFFIQSVGNFCTLYKIIA